jgi:hypothetical protein
MSFCQTTKSVTLDIETLKTEYEKKLDDKNIIINNLLKRIKELTNQLNNMK